MAKVGKKYAEAVKLIEAGKFYEPVEAIELVKKTATANFDETVEIAFNLNVDPKYADQGLMPNPKVGTVTPDVARAVNEIKAGKIEYRTDKAGIISCSIGKASFDEEKLLDNYRTIVDTIIKAKPVAAKGQYIKSVTLSATMGPGVPLNVFKLSSVTKEQ